MSILVFQQVHIYFRIVDSFLKDFQATTFEFLNSQFEFEYCSFHYYLIIYIIKITKKYDRYFFYWHYFKLFTV